MIDWLQGAERLTGIEGEGGGSVVAGPSRIGLHSTEGGWEGSLSVFRTNLTSPHILARPPSLGGARIGQLIPFSRSAYSFKNVSGGVETNRLGHTIQIEIVMFAAHAGDLTDQDADWLGHLLASISACVPGIDLGHHHPFLAYPASYGSGNGVRMTAAHWAVCNGVFGHQHVPENVHGDPGAIDIDRILDAAGGGTHHPSTPLEDDHMLLHIKGKPALFIGGLPHLVPGPLVDEYAKGRTTGVVELPDTDDGRSHYAKVSALVVDNN